MKLRIRGNSVRLRLTRGEVEDFDREGRVEDAAQFGPGARLAYALERAMVGRLSARLEAGTVVARGHAAILPRDHCFRALVFKLSRGSPGATQS